MKPTIYIDLDGVLANFQKEYSKIHLTSNNPLEAMVGTDFYYRLEPYASAQRLVSSVVSLAGSYSICSHPLRGDHKNSAKWKVLWINKYLHPQPAEILITGRKEKYATFSERYS